MGFSTSTLSASLLCLVVATALPSAHAKPDLQTAYRIVSRQGRSHRRMDEPDLDIISFDGDLDRIQQLALEEAIRTQTLSPSFSPTISTAPTNDPVPTGVPSDYPSSTPSNSMLPSDSPSLVPSPSPTHSTAPSDTPSLVPSNQPSASSSPTVSAPLTANQVPPTSPQEPVLDSATLIVCPTANEENMRMQTISFEYSVETAPDSDVQAIVDNLEKELAVELVPLLLECWDPSASFDFSVLGLDPKPADSPSSDTCLSDTDGLSCDVYDGSMRVLSSNPEEASTVIFETRSAIRLVIESPAFQAKVPGLFGATYLGPAVVAPTPFIGIREGDNPDESLGTTSFLLLAVGSAALIVFVGSVYYMRRDSPSSSDGAATQAAGSTVHDLQYDAGDRSASPFSEMLPTAYRYNENLSILSGSNGLEAVAEDNSPRDIETPPSPARTEGSSSIILSESGYTTEAADEDESLSFDVPRSLYTKVTESPELLGARKRKESLLLSHASILVDPNMSSDSEIDDSMMAMEDDSLLWTPTPKSPDAKAAGGMLALEDSSLLWSPAKSTDPNTAKVAEGTDDSMILV